MGISRWGLAATRLLLNWGALVLAVTAVLAWRYHSQERARAPLPAPAVHLSAAEERSWQAFPAYHDMVPVLVYHGVSTRPSSLSIRPRAFAQQMLALRIAGFHAITLQQYVDYIQGDRRGLPPKPVLLTFDDGRLDTYRAVNDILRNYGFHGTLFTFASWPTSNPGFSLNWNEMRAMQQSGTWTIQEHGGSGHEYVIYNSAGGRGGTYAFRQFVSGPHGGGHLESYRSFVQRTTSNILWGDRQFTTHIPGYRPLSFAVPMANYGQEATNDPRIPRFMLPWLRRHFRVIFGGDYLDRHPGLPPSVSSRYSPTLSNRISVGYRTSLPVLACRLRDWIAGVPIWQEYRCFRQGPSPAQSEP